MGLRNGIFMDMLAGGDEVLFRLEGGNVRLSLWLLDLLLPLTLQQLILRRTISFLDFVLGEGLLGSDEVLIVIVHLLDKYSVTLDRTPVVV